MPFKTATFLLYYNFNNNHNNYTTYTNIRQPTPGVA